MFFQDPKTNSSIGNTFKDFFQQQQEQQEQQEQQQRQQEQQQHQQKLIWPQK